MLIGLFPDCSKRTKRVAEPSAGKSMILDRLEHLFGDTSLTLLDLLLLSLRRSGGGFTVLLLCL